MAISEEGRHRLYQRLREVPGEPEATVLMEHIPPVGWADVATKHDLATLEQRIDLRFARVDDRFGFLERRFDQVDARLAQVDGRLSGITGVLERFQSDFSHRVACSYEHDRGLGRHDTCSPQNLSLACVTVGFPRTDRSCQPSAR